MSNPFFYRDGYVDHSGSPAEPLRLFMSQDTGDSYFQPRKVFEDEEPEAYHRPPSPYRRLSPRLPRWGEQELSETSAFSGKRCHDHIWNDRRKALEQTMAREEEQKIPADQEEESDDDYVEEYIEENMKEREYEQAIRANFLEGSANCWEEKTPNEPKRKSLEDEVKEQKIMAAYRGVVGSGEEKKQAVGMERKRLEAALRVKEYQETLANWRDSLATHGE